MALTLVRLPRFVEVSPIMPTSVKGLVGATSQNGLDFEVGGVLLGHHMASQTHSFDPDGTMHIVATDPTILQTRLGPDGQRVARTSSLVIRAPAEDDTQLLRVEGCSNRPGNDPVQCVDPTIVDLPEGGQRLYWVQSGQRVDPAFTDLPNQFRSAVLDGSGSWMAETGVRFAAPAAADPDVVRLPDGRWRMYYTVGLAVDDDTGNVAPGVMSAISADGLVFEAEPGVRAHRCSASATMALADGRYRMYCHTRDVFTGGGKDKDPRSYIVSFVSIDGLDFTQESGVRVGPELGGWGRYIGASAPSIQPHPDGGISMVITTVVEPPFPWNWLYLNSQEAVLAEMMEGLDDRARRGGLDKGPK